MPKESSGMIIARKDWPILMLVEKSDDVNTALRIHDIVEGVMGEISNTQGNSPDYEIKIGMYSFSNTSYFNHPQKIVKLSEYDISDFTKNDVVDLTGVLNQLNNDLSRSTLLNGKYGYYKPTLIFLFDGNKKYIANEALEKIKQNKWFRAAHKMAFFVNKHDVSDEDDIVKLVGDKEAVFTVNNTGEAIEILKQLLICINLVAGFITVLPSHDGMIDDRSENFNILGDYFNIVKVDPFDEEIEACTDDTDWGSNQDWE